MKFPRIAPPYRVFVLRPNGGRQPLDAQSIIVELQPGIEVEIDLAPHPNFAGNLIISTPPTQHMKRLYEAGKVDSFAVVFGAANVLHVKVERRIRARKAAARGATRRQSTKVAKGQTG